MLAITDAGFFSLLVCLLVAVGVVVVIAAIVRRRQQPAAHRADRRKGKRPRHGRPAQPEPQDSHDPDGPVVIPAGEALDESAYAGRADTPPDDETRPGGRRARAKQERARKERARREREDRDRAIQERAEQARAEQDAARQDRARQDVAAGETGQDQSQDGEIHTTLDPDSVEYLAEQANAALVDADNALKTSEQELGFAQAQYGAEATAAFARALDASRADVAEAFRIRQRLDDEQPRDEQTRRRLLKEIIGRCTAADRRLDAQAEAFDQLRALESQLDTLLPELIARRDQARSRLAVASTTWGGLLAAYADSALAPIADNVAQATARVEFASREIDRAARANAEDPPQPAAVLVRGAEQALGQADTLLDALDSFAADLAAAEEAAPEMLSDLHAEVAAGKARLVIEGTPPGDDEGLLAAAVTHADQVANDVGRDLADPRPDPLRAMRELETASAALGETLGAVRNPASRKEHAQEQLEQALFSARATIDAATEFVTTRRGAVGALARTRLSEARRRLDQAADAVESEPVGALAAARAAQALAGQALAAAHDDVVRWLSPISGYDGSSAIATEGLAGAVLGGILLDGIDPTTPATPTASMMDGDVEATVAPAGGTVESPGQEPEPEQEPDQEPPPDGSPPDGSPPDGGDSPPGRFGGPSTWGRDRAA